MPYLTGVCLALAVGAFAAWLGLDRDRAFYPTVMVVIASYYALFAVMAGGGPVLAVELAFATLFLFASAAGFRGSLWLLVGALAGHGVFDAVHGRLIANPGVPAWWPAFCLAYDVAAAGYLAWRLTARRIPIR